MSYRQGEMDKNVSIRFKEELESLEISNLDVGIFLGVDPKTVSRWRKGTAIPSDKLAMLAEKSVDVVYVLTGIRQASSYESAPLKVSETCAESTDREYREGISSEEQALLDNFRSLSEEDRRAIRRQSDVFAELNRMIKQQQDKKVG